MKRPHGSRLSAIGGLLLGAATSMSAQPYRAQIRTTAYGVPHIQAADLASVGFGHGYAFASIDLCTVAERWITVRGERSRYFGAEGRRDGRQSITNLYSDFFWRWMDDSKVVEQELAAAPPLGPTPEVRDLVRGYVAGYNKYLADVGVAKLPDKRCRGQAWVGPITEKDVYLRAMHWSLIGGSPMQWGMMDAVVPTRANAQPSPGRSQSEMDIPSTPALSNLIALGKDATDNGRGMLFANPHWRWHEPERLYELQLTVPGRLDIYGAVFEGTPVIGIGFNRGVAWTHTASVPRRDAIYQLTLVPGRPTSYVYDGTPRDMTKLTVSVRVKEPNGNLVTRTHDIWGTQFGPVVANSNLVWTPTTAYAVKNVLMNFRWLNQQAAMMLSRDVEELDRAGRTYMALGWLNTAAADSGGRVLYADRSAVPNVSDALAERCVTSELGKKLRAANVFVLDGSRADCAWEQDADAVVPGNMGPRRLPMLARTDYVLNSNDSHWVNNPLQPLEGFPPIVGDERTPRSLRTRNGMLKIERRLAGTDGHPGNRFTLDLLERITMDDKVLAGEMWRDPLVSLCRTLPPQKGIPEACDVLATWDLTDNLDSPGAVLFRRVVENMTTSATPPAELFAVPFDPKDPAHTPRGLAVDNPRVLRALTAGISDLRDNGMPLGATLRPYQYDERAGARIPIHGGPQPTGQYNLIMTKAPWTPGEGWPTVMHASTFVLWMQFTDKGPVAHSVLAPSQSDDPDSPHHADQTRLFSEKRSHPVLFEDAAIRADPSLRTQWVCAAAARSACAPSAR